MSAIRRNLLLTLDAGTSGGRAAVFDLGGRLVGVCSAPWTYDRPAVAAPWGREFDAEVFWRVLCGLARRVMAENEVAAADIVAVSATSQRQGLVLLDRTGRELYAGPNMDLRGVYQAAALDEKLGHELFRITGHQPSLLFAPARLCWFREHQPGLFERISTLLMISDWLIFRLCGALRTEPSAAAESQLFDVKCGCWSASLLQALDLPLEILPSIGVAGEVAGRMSGAAAELTGLIPGTPVVMGGADTQCGLLGLAVLDAGQLGIMAGWSLPVQQVTLRDAVTDQRLWATRHVVPDRWLIESNGGPAGRSYAWMRETLFGGCDYAELDRLAATVPCGADGAMAFLGAQAMDAHRLGLEWGGFVFPLALDFCEIRREQLVRAGLECIAFTVRANLEQLATASGVSPLRVSVGGGLTRSPVFTQILADVLGLPVALAAAPETSCAGAAMCAATGLGAFSGLRDAVSAMARFQPVLAPNRIAVAEYLDAYERWHMTLTHLQRLSAALN